MCCVRARRGVRGGLRRKLHMHGRLAEAPHAVMDAGIKDACRGGFTRDKMNQVSGRTAISRYPIQKKPTIFAGGNSPEESGTIISREYRDMTVNVYEGSRRAVNPSLRPLRAYALTFGRVSVPAYRRHEHRLNRAHDGYDESRDGGPNTATPGGGSLQAQESHVDGAASMGRRRWGGVDGAGFQTVHGSNAHG